MCVSRCTRHVCRMSAWSNQVLFKHTQRDAVYYSTLSREVFFEMSLSLCLFSISCESLLSRSIAESRLFSRWRIALTHLSMASLTILLAFVAEPSSILFCVLLSGYHGTWHAVAMVTLTSHGWDGCQCLSERWYTFYPVSLTLIGPIKIAKLFCLLFCFHGNWPLHKPPPV